MSHIERAAQNYYYSIKRPSGMTRSEARVDAYRIYGKEADQVITRLDEMLAAETPMLQGMVLQGFLSEKKGGILGFGILDGSVLSQSRKGKVRPAPRVPEEKVVSFDVWNITEANTLVRQLNNMVGRKIIDYHSYATGAPVGVLHIPERKQSKEYEGGVLVGKRETIPPAKLLVPQKAEPRGKEASPPWVVTIYTKQPYPPHYSNMPDIVFHLRTPEEHVKVDNFFESLRGAYPAYKLVYATSHVLTVTVRARKIR